MIAEFGSLPATLSAGPAALVRVVPAQAAAFLLDVHEAMLHALRLPIAQGETISTSDQLLAYLNAALAHQGTEQLRVLYLGSTGRLIIDELQAHGCISELAIYPRQVVKRALEVNAAAIILVHNHPSGDSRPSKADIEMTRRVAHACHALEIVLQDHLVVASSGWSSFRLLGLL